MELKGVEDLGAIATFIGRVEEAAAGERGKVADLPLELEELVLRQLPDVGRGHPNQLGYLMEEERAGQRPLAAQPRGAVLELDPPGRESLPGIPGVIEGDAEPAGRPRCGDPVADQPQREEVDDPGGHLDDRRPVGALLEAAHHSRPTAQRQQRPRQVFLPAVGRDPQSDQLLPDDVERGPPPGRTERSPERYGPRFGPPGTGRREADHRLEKPQLAPRHRPGGDPLIEEGATPADEEGIDQAVGVERRLEGHDEIAVAHRRLHGRHRRAGHRQRFQTRVPQIGRHLALVVELPQRRHLRDDGRAGLFVGRQDQPRLPPRHRFLPERLGEDFPPHLRIEIAAEGLDRSGLGEGPAGPGVGLAHDRMEEERPVKLAERQPPTAEGLGGDIPVLVVEDGIDIGRRDPAGSELGPVALLGEIGLGLEEAPGEHGRFVESNRLQALERILRHEHADRPLLRETGGGPGDHRPEGVARHRLGAGRRRGIRHASSLVSVN